VPALDTEQTGDFALFHSFEHVIGRRGELERVRVLLDQVEGDVHCLEGVCR
jgi:hypothetical protein